ncbi:MAG: hypothetical protein WBX50_04255 [Candidatus Deferrimicrobiaceae bacterium]
MERLPEILHFFFCGTHRGVHPGIVSSVEPKHRCADRPQGLHILPRVGPGLADQYMPGVIILAAAPCTAMVFVWSYVTDGDPAYTLVQASANDLVMLLLSDTCIS